MLSHFIVALCIITRFTSELIFSQKLNISTFVVFQIEELEAGAPGRLKVTAKSTETDEIIEGEYNTVRAPFLLLPSLSFSSVMQPLQNFVQCFSFFSSCWSGILACCFYLQLDEFKKKKNNSKIQFDLKILNFNPRMAIN